MVISRPTGHKLIDQAISAVAIDSAPFDLGNSVLINFTGHGLSDGDFVYLESDIDEYNGFWEVEVFNVNAFYLTDGAHRVEFYQEIDVDYYQTQEHDWSSIFLPIVYKVSNQFWPINFVDAERTVLSAADDNGFTDMSLSGALRGSVNTLEFVKIVGASDEDLNGVWQIVEVISTSHVVINLPYDADNSFSGATVQYYYNNFQQKVKIYAGLPDDHPWEPKKPFEEVAELSLTPDENNEVMFSVSDYIQSKVKIENNLTLYSLPLNLDAFTGFYIQTGVTYDQSDNYSLYTTTPSYLTDTFVGYAIAGKLPFKNVYAGDYADYVYTSGSPAQWLTNRARLLGVEGYFFDVSFIKNIVGAFYIVVKKYLTTDYYLEETLEFENLGIGVYRVPLTLDANYSAWCIQAFQTGFTPEVMDALNLWLEDGSGYEWTDTTTPQTFLINNFDSENKYTDYGFEAGQGYIFSFEFQTILSGTPVLTRSVFIIRVKDVSDVTLLEWEIDMLSGGESLPPLNEWISRPTVNSKEWTISAAPTVDLDGSNSDNIVSELLYCDYIFTSGRTYHVDANITITLNSGSISGQTVLQVLDASFNPTNDFNTSVVGTNTYSMTFVASSNHVKFGLFLSIDLGVSDITVVVNSVTIQSTAGQTISDTISFVAPAGATQIAISAEQTGTGSVTYRVNSFTNDTATVAEVAITEELCIDILEACDVESGFVSTEGRRLTEDGGYRLLE